MSESLRRQISSPAALFAFEATARLGGFGAAAAEMNVTQPSISYQIRNLERHLGTRLFERRGRIISLTEDGEMLYRAVRGGFAQIRTGLAEIEQRADPDIVTLCLSSSAAAHFLLPRYPRLDGALSDIGLSLKIMSRDVNPASENADFAIRLGSGDWDDLQSWRLFDEVYFPLCAPELFDKAPEEVTLEDLKARNLLFLRERHRARDDWNAFFRTMGAPITRTHGRMIFSDQQALLQAAVGGQGIGLGWLGMTDSFLQNGSLVKPTTFEVRTGRAFHLVAPVGLRPKPGAIRFMDWMLAQGREIQASPASVSY